MLRVYPASKLRHAEMWERICAECAECTEFQFHARWLKHVKMGTPDDAKNAVMFWQQNIQDVLDADIVLVYAEKIDNLRGALVEVGIALGAKIPVIAVVDNDQGGTWQFHPNVLRANNLQHALSCIPRFKPKYLR